MFVIPLTTHQGSSRFRDESLFHTKFLYESFGLMARPNAYFALETCVTRPLRSTFTQIQIKESMTKMLTSQSQEN